MNMSSLARRLEEYEAEATSLKLERAPVTRRLMPQGPQCTLAESGRPVRRARIARTIQIRDQGLRPFRVS